MVSPLFCVCAFIFVSTVADTTGIGATGIGATGAGACCDAFPVSLSSRSLSHLILLGVIIPCLLAFLLNLSRDNSFASVIWFAFIPSISSLEISFLNLLVFLNLM